MARLCYFCVLDCDLCAVPHGRYDTEFRAVILKLAISRDSFLWRKCHLVLVS